MTKLSILYTTFSSQEEAESLAQKVLSEKLAACVNIFPAGRSLYLWKGRLEENVECYVIFKTLPDLLEDLERYIINNHSYDTPAILKIEAQSSKAFFDYVRQEI